MCVFSFLKLYSLLVVYLDVFVLSDILIECIGDSGQLLVLN